MAFSPSTTIYLCNVPIDNTYKNQIYFSNVSAQQSYFMNKVVKTFTEYLTVREKLPNGSIESSIKVNANIDTIRSLPCNYMFYQNANHGTKYFYAFITKIIYVNEGTTKLVFETDVYQTWLFNVTLKPSYVVREHSKTDEIGDNLVPEKFNFQDYVYTKIGSDSVLNKWGYLVGCTELNFDTSSTSAGHLMSGIYQGLYFYYYENENNLSDFLAEFDVDCIQFIAVIPKFCVSANTIGANDNDRANGQGFMYSSNNVATQTKVIDYTALAFGDYAPKNKKLYTAPFYKMIVTNHNGEEAEYNIEDFTNRSAITFRYYGDVSANPTVTLYPCNYKGVTENYDSGISISGFPQCSYANDSFKLWLAKNQFGVGLDTVGNIGQIIAGVATGVASGGIAGAIGATQVVSGVSGIMNTVNSVYQASKEPNRAHTGSSKNNLLTAIGFNKFDFYSKRIKPEYMHTIDDFFTMYGYQTNRVKTPNVSSRPYFNYVQTVDCNIVGGIPSDDMERLKAVYNNGVTLWKSTATVGDYSVDNRPT